MLSKGRLPYYARSSALVHKDIRSSAGALELSRCVHERRYALDPRLHTRLIPGAAALDPVTRMAPICHFKPTFQWNSCI